MIAPTRSDTFKKAVLPCRVVSVVDGDTVKVITRADPSDRWLQYSVRISECDAPEMKGPTDLERQAAAVAKAFVQNLIQSSGSKGLGVLHCSNGQDKYGRLLGDIVLCGQSVSIGQQALHAGVARAYNGGTKDGWTPAELARIISKPSSQIRRST
jgi:endonuclease YncB( thermonuclease family)